MCIIPCQTAIVKYFLKNFSIFFTAKACPDPIGDAKVYPPLAGRKES